MAIYFEMTSATGTQSRMALQPGMQRIKAAIGDRYRIYDEATGRTPPDIVVKRLDSHLVVEGLPGGASLELTEFYARCGVSSPCSLVVDTPGLFQDGSVAISPSSPPLRALTDGSFVLYPSGYSAEPAVAVADSEGFGWRSGWAVGGLSVAALAAAGGGGGDDAPPPVAVSPSPPAPPPTPSPGPSPAPPLDTTPPDRPQVTSAKSATTATPVVTGSAEAGSTVRIDVDTDLDGQPEAVFETVADAAGAWRLDLASARPVQGELPDGLPAEATTRFTVVAIDAFNNPSGATQFELAVDAVAPGAPRITAIVDDQPARTGVVADGGRTNDLTPAIEGRLDAALAAGDRLELLRNGETVSVLTDVAGLNWRVTDAGLAFGESYVYEARVVDAAGNVGTQSNGYRIVVQAGTGTFASVTAVTDDVPSRTGNVSNGGVTNDDRPTISGTLSAALVAGESLQVFRNGSALGTALTVDGASWRFTDGRLNDGSYSYTVRVTDAEGAGPVSAAYAITVDTVNSKTATITSVTDNVSPSTGTIRDGGSTNDPSPTLTGRLSSALTSGEELQILRNDVVIATSTSTSTNGVNWSFTDSGLSNGNYDYNVRVVDAAGNIGRESSTWDIRVTLTGGSGKATVNPDDRSIAFGALFAAPDTAATPADPAVAGVDAPAGVSGPGDGGSVMLWLPPSTLLPDPLA